VTVGGLVCLSVGELLVGLGVGGLVGCKVC
jgi:hypothetical protein